MGLEGCMGLIWQPGWWATEGSYQGRRCFSQVKVTWPQLWAMNKPLPGPGTQAGAGQGCARMGPIPQRSGV